MFSPLPADLKEQTTGLRLAIPLADDFVFITLSAHAQSVRFSLRTADPSEIKTRQATVGAFLEGVWKALREDAPIKLSHRQATALAGELYRIWADGEYRARSIAIEQKPGGGWHRVSETQADEETYWAAIVAMWEPDVET